MFYSSVILNGTETQQILSAVFSAFYSSVILVLKLASEWAIEADGFTVVLY